MKLIYLSGAAALAWGIIAAPPSLGQSDDPYAPCAATEGDAARLACFDAIYARQRESRTERRVREAERSKAEFGLSSTQIRAQEEQLGEAREEAEGSQQLAESGADMESVSAQVAEVFTDARGRPVILLGNGQLWSTTSNRSFRGTIRPEWQATVTKSWSGGYRMTFAERSGFLSVRRIR